MDFSSSWRQERAGRRSAILCFQSASAQGSGFSFAFCIFIAGTPSTARELYKQQRNPQPKESRAQNKWGWAVRGARQQDAGNGAPEGLTGGHKECRGRSGVEMELV